MPGGGVFNRELAIAIDQRFSRTRDNSNFWISVKFLGPAGVCKAVFPSKVVAA